MRLIYCRVRQSTANTVNTMGSLDTSIHERNLFRGVMKRQLKVCWISAGVSSFIAGYLERKSIDEFIYIDIENQHPDSMRFIKECEVALGKPIQILRSPYRNVENVIKQFRFINGPYGARCTQILKKRVRKEWEDFHKD